MYIIKFSKRAEKDMKQLKEAGFERKVKTLLNIIRINPLQSPPPFEKLLWDFRGCFSRRINDKHRLVYEILDNTENFLSSDGTPYDGVIRVLQMWTHYE